MTAPYCVHLLTGEYPPGSGGVGDYTAQLAEGLSATGCDVHVWCPSANVPRGGITFHALPDRFGSRSRRIMARAFARAPGCVLLQYVPNACGARGANVAFCRWLARQGRTLDVRVMFHEPYFYFGWNPATSALAFVQRAMAAYLLRAAPVVYLSTETWARYLRPYAPAGTAFVPLPIPATVDVEADPGAVAAWRRRLAGNAPLVAHFGTYGKHVARDVTALLPALLSAHPSARFVCAGRGSDAFAARFRNTGRVVAAGDLDAASVAALLQAADLAVQPYPDGVTTRRTTAMACIANGVPTVTTSGELTEPVWRETGAVALAPAGDAARFTEMATALLRDADARAALAAAGRRTYQREFSLEHTINRLVRSVIPARVSA